MDGHISSLDGNGFSGTAVRQDPYSPPVDLVTHVYEVVRDAIFTGEFMPGQQLKEQVIANELGLSRTPVREALKKLAVDGFTVAIPRCGVFVREWSLDDRIRLLMFRRSIEAGAAPLAAQAASPGEISQLDRMATALDAAIDAKRWTLVHEYELKFHRRLIEITRNEDLLRIASNTQLIFLSMGNSKSLWGANQEENPRFRPVPHTSIVETLREKDTNRAFKVMWDHFSIVINRLEYMKTVEDFDGIALESST